MAPVALVTALRETSVIFGAIFAAWFLKEGFGPQRIALSVILVGGLALLKLA
jgi:drug/metabolite transporter (DMT)-like permease